MPETPQPPHLPEWDSYALNDEREEISRDTLQQLEAEQATRSNSELSAKVGEGWLETEEGKQREIAGADEVAKPGEVAPQSFMQEMQQIFSRLEISQRQLRNAENGPRLAQINAESKYRQEKDAVVATLKKYSLDDLHRNLSKNHAILLEESANRLGLSLLTETREV